LADSIRQIATNLGARPHRVFLNWTQWTGEERGDGNEILLLRREVLPTPRVDNLDAVTFSVFHAGTIPAGSVKVTEISLATFTEDQLRGLDSTDPATGKQVVPTAAVNLDGGGLLEPYDFFFEVVEDGRGDPKPERMRYRLLSKPFRRATKLDWLIMLERSSQDRTRGDRSVFGAPGRP
jgi:hypothetical protein